MRKRAFTLLELLIAITIIGMLLGLLSSSLRRALRGTVSMRCMNNLRQIGMATNMYLEDNNCRYPTDRTPFWFTLFDRYLDDLDVLECPAHNEYIPGDGRFQSYAYNRYLSDVHENRITSPSQCMLFTDSTGTGVMVVVSGYGRIEKTYSYIDFNTPLGDRHMDGCNVLFTDNHSSWIRPSDVPTTGPKTADWWNN